MMATPRQKAEEWLDKVSDAALKEELERLFGQGTDQDIADAFFQDLSFGTAGLRGIVGVGTNRMNIYTVGRATQGLASYLTSQETKTTSVAIARDSRHGGELFVRHAACVLAANGIKVHLYPRIEPTPALSFAVRDLGCAAGICMTASHNPAQYNGYKVYGSDGCQITEHAAELISAAIDSTDPFSGVRTMPIDEAEALGLVTWIDDDVIDRFVSACLKCGFETEAKAQEKTHVVYTPLCGTGLECIERVVKQQEGINLTLVESQATPNGDFPTCTYPNPEERVALEEGITTCARAGADLLIATDPDADRVGVAVRHNGDYVLPTGNEMGVLLFDYICSMRKAHDTMPECPLVVSTIVSSAMVDEVAREWGVEVRRTLTGFKYIGEILSSLEAQGEEDRFVFGFEESYGYLPGAHVRDKDAISTGLLICQMAQHYKNRGQDLVDALNGLYERYGHYANRTINVAFPGAEGAEKMAYLMDRLRTERSDNFSGIPIESVTDYLTGVHNLPKSNVMEFALEDQRKVIVRPSGTEPKVKLYLFAKGSDAEDATQILNELENASRKLLG